MQSDSKQRPPMPPLDSVDSAALCEQWRNWAEAEFGALRSQSLAAAAGAIRAIEQHQDRSQAALAGRLIAAAWKPPEGLKPLGMTAEAEDQWLHWAQSEFGGPLSRVLIGAAGAMRAIEARQDQTHVIDAARSCATAWHLESTAAPANGSPTPAPAAQDPEPPAGVVRGTVAGFVKRDVPLPNGRSSVDGVMWSFSLVRRWIGSNGHPMLPVPVQLQGWRIDGALEEGDVAEFDGEAPPSTVVQPKQLRNVTKGNEIVVRDVGEKPSVRIANIVTTLLSIVIIVVFACVFYVTATHR